MLALLAPRWFDHSLAGYAFAYDETHKPTGVRDPKTGFMLVRSVECDGGLLTLLLTRDRREVVKEGFKLAGTETANGMAIVAKALPSLRTGKGLVIGDSPLTVRNRLGRPKHTERHGRFLDYVYAARLGRYDPFSKSSEKAEYEERYTFKAANLIEVRFFRDQME